jgi:two-component system response regulator
VELTLRAFKKNSILNEVVVVRDGAEALEYFFGPQGCTMEGKDGNPAVVLLDLKLPKVDGIEVLRQIRADERTKYVPVVILTSSKDQKDVLNGYKLGCNSYIRKPVDFNQFIDSARQLGLYWLMLNELPPEPRM